MRAYQLNGNTVPSYKGEPLALTNEQFVSLNKNPVVAGLIKAGAIFVTDKAPTDPTKQTQALTNQNAELILQNTKLQEEKEALEAKLKEAGSTDEAVRAAIEKQKEEDRAEIKALQEEKDAEIAKLKEQLKAAKK